MSDELRDEMVSALRSKPCRSRELFATVMVDVRRGRETLAGLIDEGLVSVDTDWTLRLRKPTP